jgi:hypothetical protein
MRAKLLLKVVAFSFQSSPLFIPRTLLVGQRKNAPLPVVARMASVVLAPTTVPWEIMSRYAIVNLSVIWVGVHNGRALRLDVERLLQRIQLPWHHFGILRIRHRYNPSCSGISASQRTVGCYEG